MAQERQTTEDDFLSKRWCAPIVQAFESDACHAKRVDNAATVASGLRVPQAVGDFMILEVVRNSGGVAMSAPEGDIPKWMQLANSKEGIAVCPETAVCLGVLDQLMGQGKIQPKDACWCSIPARRKYPESVTAELPANDMNQPIDWGNLAG